MKRYGFPLLFLLLCLTAVFTPQPFHADDVSTTVIAGNTPPSFSGSPAESPESSDTTPTNAGSNVTFVATATDSSSESFYLAVCKTDAVTAVNSDAPTCDDGSWCVSTATASGSQASCNYATQASDPESNDWYAFVCDGNASAQCSTSLQGSGDSGSPYKVNHKPTFHAVSNNTPRNPGQTITWNTDVSTLDGDSDGPDDTVRLIVCKTTGITNDDCDGGASDRWCQSSYVSNNPTCGYNLPTPTPDQSYNAYVYLVDNHYMPATDAIQGSNSSYTVNNIAPIVSGVTLNSGSAITLTENTTTNINATATISDDNSCSDLSTVTASMYRSSITYDLCDTIGNRDNNNCYAVYSCTVDGGTCSGTTDESATYTCTVAIQYHADPTLANTQFPSDTWKDTILATDNNASTDSLEIVTGVEMNTLIALDVTGSIHYGTLNIGQANDPLDRTTTVSATGNVGIDEELSGTDMTGIPSGSIDVNYQHYALASSTAYASGVVLTDTDTETELNCQKTTVTLTKETKDTWWGIMIPLGSPVATYTGTNYVNAVLGEVVNW